MKFIVLMRRWGNEEGHTYILGMWDNPCDASDAGKVEIDERGGKYEYEVWEIDSDNTCMKIESTCGDQLPFYQQLLDDIPTP